MPCQPLWQKKTGLFYFLGIDEKTFIKCTKNVNVYASQNNTCRFSDTCCFDDSGIIKLLNPISALLLLFDLEQTHLSGVEEFALPGFFAFLDKTSLAVSEAVTGDHADIVIVALALYLIMIVELS